jgi:hypothetical protein
MILRRATTLLLALLLVLGATATSALAMEPAGAPAKERFGCVDGEASPIAGHPGAAGLTHAAPRVAGLTGNPNPTAWNAVHRADPIDLGGC